MRQRPPAEAGRPPHGATVAHHGRDHHADRPNILLVVSDQERQRSWLPPGVSLPWRDRLRAEGLEFTDYFTHSSPCSPSRASLFTGRYLEGHGVLDNVIMPEHAELPTSTPTLGSLLDGAGYRSSYIGKWHLSHSPTPDMEAYGFADWDGNDRHFMGWAGTGVHFDPIIATNAAHWLEPNAGPAASAGPRGRLRQGRALVPDRGPGQPARRHVVPGRPARLPRSATPTTWPPSARCSSPPPGRTTTPSPSSPTPTPRWSTSCRPTSTTTSTPSPRPTGSGAGTSSTGCGATSTRRTRRPGCATSTTTSTSTSWPTAAWAPCWPPSRPRGRGTTPSSSSPPTTATCAAPTGCAPRDRSSTTRSCGCRST